MSNINSLEDIKYCLYINLTSRIDRKESVEYECSKIGINGTRFDAIKMGNGRIGCSMSHLECLKIAKNNNWNHIMILEDDIQFLNPEIFINQINKFFKNEEVWDVLLLAGNNISPYQEIGDYAIKVSHCQTTTGYIIKNHYYDVLIENIKEGIGFLTENPNQHKYYAIDKYWLQLQKKNNWYLIIPPTVVQKEDYSDIEKKQTNYIDLMTNLNKEYPFKKNLYQYHQNKNKR